MILDKYGGEREVRGDRRPGTVDQLVWDLHEFIITTPSHDHAPNNWHF